MTPLVVGCIENILGVTALLSLAAILFLLFADEVML